MIFYRFECDHLASSLRSINSGHGKAQLQHNKHIIQLGILFWPLMWLSWPGIFIQERKHVEIQT